METLSGHAFNCHEFFGEGHGDLYQDDDVRYFVGQLKKRIKSKTTLELIDKLAGDKLI